MLIKREEIGKAKHRLSAGPGCKKWGRWIKRLSGCSLDDKGEVWQPRIGGIDSKKIFSEQEAKSYSDAYSLRVRNELHFLQTPVDILHLEKQPEVAIGLG